MRDEGDRCIVVPVPLKKQDSADQLNPAFLAAIDR